ncbi:MAG TPA: hypothetical protein VF903_06275, partial [Nitrospirota bacterium]
FSERVKAEVIIVRLKIRMDEVRDRINELYLVIGRTVVDLAKKNDMPAETEQLLKHDDIVSAMNEIASRERELEDLRSEIGQVRDAAKPQTKQAEDTTV